MAGILSSRGKLKGHLWHLHASLLNLPNSKSVKMVIRKSRARSSRCCGLALSHGLGFYIGLTSLHLSPLDGIVQEKLL